MTKEERYAIWNRYYQKHKTEINARRKIVRENYKNKLSKAENKIAELTEQNTSLLTSVENLNKSVQELEAQIEKMKCCENCAWWYKLPNGQRDCAETCENLDNWSLRR